MALFQSSFFESLVEGVGSLDKRDIERMAKKFLTVETLPMGDIQRWLEQRWRPDASALLAPGSITASILPFQFAYGGVSAAGAKTSGDGFSVAHVAATGFYTVTFNPVFTSVPAMGITPTGGGQDERADTITVSGFTITTFLSSPVTPTDAPFSFIAMAPR